jgi:hypothetical protein
MVLRTSRSASSAPPRKATLLCHAHTQPNRDGVDQKPRKSLCQSCPRHIARELCHDETHPRLPNGNKPRLQRCGLQHPGGVGGNDLCRHPETASRYKDKCPLCRGMLCASK